MLHLLALLAGSSVVTVVVATVVREDCVLHDLNSAHVGQTNCLQHRLGVGIDRDASSVNCRLGRDVVVLALTLLLLELEGDTTDGALLNTLHQVSDESGNLVAESLGGDLSDLFADLLVGVEVKSEARVVLLDDHASGLLDRLCSNATHVCGFSVKNTTKLEEYC